MHNIGMVIKARLALALEESDKTQADLARACGISTAGVSNWFKDDGKKYIDLKSSNLENAAECLNVSERWLTGKSNNRRPEVSNIRLVRDFPDVTDIQVMAYRDAEFAAGSGATDVDETPGEYVTFKASWIKRKGFMVESLRVIYVRGDSMSPRIQDGDAVLIRTDQTELMDDRIYAFNFSGLARLKRIIRRSNGNIVLKSDNDPDGDLREELTPETFDQLRIIGKAVWVGGDLA